MMKFGPAICCPLLGVALWGCGTSSSNSGAAPSLSYTVSVRNLTPKDGAALQAGNYSIEGGSVLATTPLESARIGMGFESAARKKGYSFDLAHLRNPGVMVFIFREHLGKPMSSSDRFDLVGLAKTYGATILPGEKVPIKFGPDGRTPMVMKSRTYFIPEKYNTPGVIEVSLHFPDKKTAEEAHSYIDPASYQVVLHPERNGVRLVATCREATGAATDEYDAFGPLIKKLGGRFEYAQGPAVESDSYDSGSKATPTS